MSATVTGSVSQVTLDDPPQTHTHPQRPGQRGQGLGVL